MSTQVLSDVIVSVNQDKIVTLETELASGHQIAHETEAVIRTAKLACRSPPIAWVFWRIGFSRWSRPRRARAIGAATSNAITWPR